MEFYTILNKYRSSLNIRMPLSSRGVNSGRKLLSQHSPRGPIVQKSQSMLMQSLSDIKIEIPIPKIIPEYKDSKIRDNSSIIQTFYSSDNRQKKIYDRQVQKENQAYEHKYFDIQQLELPIKQYSMEKPLKFEILEKIQISDDDLIRQLSEEITNESNNSFITSFKDSTHDQTQISSIDSQPITLFQNLDDILK